MGRQSEIENYMKSHSLFHEALSKLKKGREIALQLEDGTDFVIFADGPDTCVEFRAPKNADVCFVCTEAAINQMLASDYGSVADFGIDVVRSIAKAEMRIKILTGPFKLLTGGYVDIIRLGGGKFFSKLADYGIKGPTDIVKVFKKMKKG